MPASHWRPAARLRGVTTGDTGGRGCGTWVFVVVPALVVGVFVAVVALAVRPTDDDRPTIDGPAAELPAVTDAMAALLTTSPPAAERAAAIGARAGAVGHGLVTIGDELDFAAEFDRLPDAEASRLGQLVGAIQRELSPAALGGPRGDGDRRADTVFALQLISAAAPLLDPDADAATQALNVLPAAVPLADDGEAIVAAVTAGDMDQAADLLEPVLSEAGAAELISGLAGDLSDRLGGRNDDRLAEFQQAYNLELP